MVDLSAPNILGIDSGVTVGIAVINIDFELVALLSRKGMSKNDVVRFVSKFGKPIIVATDVNPPSSMVRKISSSLGCRLFYPYVSMSNYEKGKLVKDYKEEIGDTHQKDALASAIRALKNYNTLFKNIKDNLKSKNLMGMYYTVVLELFRSKSDNIKDIIERVSHES